MKSLKNSLSLPLLLRGELVFLRTSIVRFLQEDVSARISLRSRGLFFDQQTKSRLPLGGFSPVSEVAKE
jgi:hypothetical protein